jgi:hypothetical protein
VAYRVVSGESGSVSQDSIDQWFPNGVSRGPRGVSQN